MTWTTIKHSVRELDPTAEHDANLSDLITALDSVTPPNQVTRNGYDGSISLHWDGVEIATYADRFETYEFNDGNTVIRHWPHASGAPVASELIDGIKATTS